MLDECPTVTIQSLVDQQILDRPIDGNHGAIHPKTSDFVGTGIPFIMASDLKNGEVDFTGCAFITLQQAQGLRKGFAKTGDVLISHKGTVGRTALIGPLTSEYIVLTPQVTYYRVRDTSKLCRHFLKYYFDSPDFQELFDNWSNSGSTRAYLGITEQARLPVAFPPIQVQREIVDILKPIDDKIDHNRKLNLSLETMARTLFQSWFVDFDPGVAKAEGRQPFGAPSEVAAMFPAEFTESTIGPIPREWEPGSVESLGQYVNGRNFTGGASGSGRMVIRIAELNSRPGPSTIYNSISSKPENTAYPDDILFAWSGSLDVYRWHRDEGLVNQHIFKVVCQKYPKWFVYHHLVVAMPFFQGIAADKATTMGHIKREHLQEATITLPPISLVESASRIFTPMFDRIHANERQILSLTALRDALLPELLLGNLRLADAEHRVEHAL